MDGYTIAEVIIVMLIIAVIVAVTIGITKAKLDNVLSYTYYNGYSTLREITTDMLANWDPKNPEYKQANKNEETTQLAHVDFSNGLQNPILKLKDRLLSSYRDIWSQPALALCSKVYVAAWQSCSVAGGYQCNSSSHLEGDGCYACCTNKDSSGGINPGGGGLPSGCSILPAANSYDCSYQQRGYWCSSIGSGVCLSSLWCCQAPCTISCSGGFTVDTSSCSCVCNKYCSGNTYLDYNTCMCKSYSVTCWDGSTASSYSSCPPKITCWDGSYATSSYNCPSKVTCWNGTYATSSSNCPPKIPCWDGSYVTNSLYCPKATCWNGTQASTPSNCPPKIPCWDGSYATSSSNCPKATCWDGSQASTPSNCPSYVTCWDGSKKYNWSQCPACTNKPNPLPCGQGWDEHTCKLTGTAKTCPSGQHLNSGCECVADCPTNLTPCQQCSNETGVVSKNPNINRTCSDETYEWSEEQCKCIISPRTLPRKGANFCKLFEANANIMSNTDVCQGSAIASNTTDFSDKKPDITLRNGLRIYNMHNDATAIAMLAGNTQGGVYDGVPNTNAYGYTVYIDIDGAKGDSKLWSDVYPFYITLSGKVIPGYDHVANPNGAGGDSTSHLQVSVEYEHYNGGKRNISWLAKSVPFKDGACIAGYVGDATPYCKNAPSVSKSSNCTTDANSVCRVKQIKPVKFFF